MKAVGIIPARYGSTRFPGKPLAKIHGKPLIQWVVEAARTSELLHEVVVATDDPRIESFVSGLGIKVKMTDSDLPSGSDRVWQAIQGEDCDVVVNIQGDEPLLEGAVVDALLQPFTQEPNLEMATLARPINSGDLESSNTAKIVVNHVDEALYFSRLPIPYSRGKREDLAGACLKHIGIYAYRPEFLGRFCKQGAVPLELAEGLEQLRALYLGAKIKVVSVDSESWGVDTPEDVIKVEQLLLEKGRV